MRKALAFVPAHISGFFQPCEAGDPKCAGSRNCGPCLDLGVLTEVRVSRANRTSVKVTIDGKRAPEAETTKSVVHQFMRMAGGPLEVEVNHSCQVPVGAGYGVSGAGALGATLALSRALGLNLPRNKLVAIAHVSEVTCHTGLGDVGAQAVGGLVIGVRPGAPPYGRWKRITVPTDLKIVCATLGPLSTKSFLLDEDFKRRAGELGGRAIKRLVEKPTLERFIIVSRDFADGLGLLDDELKALIRAAEAAGALGASQVMLGRAVFALVRERNIGGVKRALSGLLEPRAIITTNINRKGPRF